MDEVQIDPVFDMPFLLSKLCRDLRQTIKSTWKVLTEFCHLRKNWCIEYLSDEIAIKMGKKLSLPSKIQCSNSSTLYQIQEVVDNLQRYF